MDSARLTIKHFQITLEIEMLKGMRSKETFDVKAYDAFQAKFQRLWIPVETLLEVHCAEEELDEAEDKKITPETAVAASAASAA